jgi:F0F1-type ATP synthase assembly protein I
MIKTVNGKRYIQWGRVLMAAIMLAMMTNGIVLSHLGADQLDAFTAFISSPGFVTITGLLGASIGVNSVVRSIIKKPEVGK